MKKLSFVCFLIISLFVLSSCNSDGKINITLPIETETNETNPLETTPTEPLNTPQNVFINQHILSWELVPDVDGYIVYIEDRIFEIKNETTFDLSLISMSSMEHEIFVGAFKGFDVSEKSEPVFYNPNATSDETHIRHLVSAVYHPGLEEDLSLDDFISTSGFIDYYGYVNYMRNAKKADLYASAASLLNLAEQDALNFISQMMTLLKNIDTSPDFSSLLDAFNFIEDYHITPYDSAYLFYHMSLSSYDSMIAYYDANIEIYQYELDRYNDLIHDRLISIDRDEDYAYLISIADASMIDAIDHMMLNTEQGLDLYDAFRTMSYERYGYFQIYFDPTYHFEDQETIDYVFVLKDLINLVYLDNPQFLFDFYTKPEFVNIDLWKNEKPELLGKIARYMNLIEIQENDKEQYIDYENVYVAALERVFDFLYTMKSSFPENAISMIDDSLSGNSLSTLEWVTLIHEISDMLNADMPSSFDFSVMYQALMSLSIDMNPLDQNLSIETSLLGTQTYQKLHCFLSFVSSINELMLQGYIDDFNQIYPQVNNSHPITYTSDILALLFKVISDYESYVESMMCQPPVELDIDTLRLMHMTFFNLFDAENMYYSETEIRMASLIDYFDQVYLAYETLNPRYEDLFNVASDTQSDFFDFLDVFLLTTFRYTWQAVPIPEIDSFLNGFESTQQALLETLSKDEIASLLDVFAIPEIAVLETHYDIDFNSAYDEIKDSLVDVFYQLNTLSNEWMTHLSLLDPNAFSNADSRITFPFFLMMIEALDSTLDQTNKTLFLDTIDLIFDDLISNPAYLVVNQLTLSEVEVLRENWIQAIEQLFVDIHEIANMDLNALTDENFNYIENIRYKFERLYFDFDLLVKPDDILNN